MKKSWQTKPLGEVCQIKPPKSEARAAVSADRLVSFLPMEDLGIDEKFVRATQAKLLSAVVGSYTYFADGDVLLAKITPCFENGKLGIAEGLTNGIGFGSSEYIVLRPDQTLSKEWLYYYLSREVFRVEGAARMSGAVGHQRIAKEFIEGYPIPIPPLPEQRRIVGILDEAFEGIAITKANAEKNLHNARALFESHLQSVFTQRGKGWVDKRLGDVCRTGAGGTPLKSKKEYYEGGNIPWLMSGEVSQGEVLSATKFITRKGLENSSARMFPKDTVLVAMYGATAGAVGILRFEASTNQAVCGILPDNKFIPEFLFYVLLSKKRELVDQATGNAQPNISQIKIKNTEIPFITLPEQRTIVAKLESLSEETQRLESIYQRKLAALDELKKSLLNQAFTGQLTAGQPIQLRSTVIPFPATLPNITTTDLHAGVLAMAFEQHQKNGKESYFTHVKAEKIAHMVEAHLGLDLGRAPVKDAAGPNDFPHLIKVEHRARMANYFDFKQVGTTYQVRKLGGFERLIDKTRTVLGDRHEAVERLLQRMLPMTVRQAEIIATVFAAWNNLLLDKKHPTDEQIVFEARENWHPDKLNIPRWRFFKAVQWLRDQGRVPEGKGRRVADKGS